MSNHCSSSNPTETPCPGLFCPKDRTYLGLTIQKDGNEEVTETFCVADWTPEQFQALRAFVGSGASLVEIEDLKRIQKPHLRLFHLVHTVFGPDLITHFYSKVTIRDYKRALRKDGFSYPKFRRYHSTSDRVSLHLRGRLGVA